MGRRSSIGGAVERHRVGNRHVGGGEADGKYDGYRHVQRHSYWHGLTHPVYHADADGDADTYADADSDADTYADADAQPQAKAQAPRANWPTANSTWRSRNYRSQDVGRRRRDAQLEASQLRHGQSGEKPDQPGSPGKLAELHAEHDGYVRPGRDQLSGHDR